MSHTPHFDPHLKLLISPPLGAMMSSLLFLFYLIIAISTLDFHYHNNSEIEQYLLQVNASNPDIAHLYSIGQSVRGNRAMGRFSCPIVSFSCLKPRMLPVVATLRSVTKVVSLKVTTTQQQHSVNNNHLPPKPVFR